MIQALVVDDDEIVASLIELFLSSRGYEVRRAGDGVEALALLRVGGFQLLVTDWNMPRMDGIALCREARALERDTYLYAIMLTASGDEDTLVAAMEAGADDFLAKPLRPAELGARLRAAERVLALEADLTQRNRDLAHAYAQVSRELELARELQLGVLPDPGRVGGFAFEWFFRASSFVGGDTFDYFQAPHDRTCFFLVDVVGHGVAAAMAAFSTQHQLRALSLQVLEDLAPDAAVTGAANRIVTEFNRRFMQAASDPGHYLTMLYGIADAGRRELALVRAGHPPVLLSTGAGAPFEAAPGGDLPIGILPDARYEAERLELAPGMRLALYSDGVTDSRNAQGESYGMERLAAGLSRSRAEPLQEAVRSLANAAIAWRGGEFEDDATVLLAEVV
jgi:sigma-B regulation protein RsbU (phosphoserine phosphatase)